MVKGLEFNFDSFELYCRILFARIEKAGLYAYEAKPLAAERYRAEAGYAGVTPFHRPEPTKYDSESARAGTWIWLNG